MTSLGPGACREIEAGLDEQLAALDGLQDALEAEREALRSAAPEQLDAATASKGGWVERLETGRAALLECTARHGHDARESLDHWLERAGGQATALRERLARVRAATRHCLERNQRNGAVIEGANRQVSEALAAVHGGDARTGSTYDSAGGRDGPGGAHLGNA